MRRGEARAKCGCHKTAWDSRKAAEKAMVRVGAERVYWCAEAGGWHLTRYSKSENDARHAALLSAAEQGRLERAEQQALQELEARVLSAYAPVDGTEWLRNQGRREANTA